MMTVVNYFVLGELFSLLERIELIDGVAFLGFDPDVETDVETIARKFIQPSIDQATCENREAIARAIAFYSEHGNAPFQLMKDRCQELTLPDSVSWPTFFHRIGVLIFGSDYREKFRVADVEEFPDEKASETILRRV